MKILSYKVAVITKLEKIEKTLKLLLEKENAMSVELDALTAQVAETNGAIDSAIVLIQGLSARLAAIANDPAAILALAAELDTKELALRDAIASTPAP